MWNVGSIYSFLLNQTYPIIFSFAFIPLTYFFVILLSLPWVSINKPSVFRFVIGKIVPEALLLFERGSYSSIMATANDEPPIYPHDLSTVQQLEPPIPMSLSMSMSKPMSMSMSRSTMPMTPPELEEDDEQFINGSHDFSNELNYLVHRLNRKPILQDSIYWHQFLQENENENENEQPPQRHEEELVEEDEKEEARQESRFLQYESPMAIPTNFSMQPLEPTPLLDPIPEFSMQCDYNPSIPLPPAPPSENLLPPLPGHDRLNGQVIEEKHARKTSDPKRPRRATETRNHKSASNHRMLDLVSGMIENGVQCNVQNSTPPSPTRTSSTSSVLLASVPYIEPYETMDSYMLPSRMELEVDLGFGEHGEQNNETTFSDPLHLRRASTPNGIRKSSVLRYRSSSEAALACKTMKKCVPRMRRRRRTSPPSSNPHASSSTSQPSTMA